MNAFPLVVGAFLIGTGASKTFFAAKATALPLAYGIPQWLIVGAVQGELLVGFLLLFGRWPYASWIAALSLFFVFATFSLYRGIAGHDSCGCFGQVHVNPWAVFTLDVAILSLLIAKRRSFTEHQEHSFIQSQFGFGIVASIYVMFAGLALLVLLMPGPGILRAEESMFGSKLVVLRPTEWIAGQFPIRDWISPQIDVSNGDWIVLLFHHDCQTCREALPRYQDLAAQFATLGNNRQVLLIEMPPFDVTKDASGLARRARLVPEREWFVQTPVEIQLSGGRVEFASLELPSIANLRLPH